MRLTLCRRIPILCNEKQKPSVMLAMPNNMAEDNNSLHSISGISMMLISLLLLWSTAFDVQFVLGTFERTLCHVERKKKMRSAAIFFSSLLIFHWLFLCLFFILIPLLICRFVKSIWSQSAETTNLSAFVDYVPVVSTISHKIHDPV